MTESDMLDIMIRLWEEGTTRTLDPHIAIELLKSAILHVENIDYPQDNTFTMTDGNIIFTTTPADSQIMLYVYHALKTLQSNTVSENINNGNIGVSFKSGLDSISNSGAGKIQEGLKKDFDDMYKKALSQIKRRAASAYRIDLYA